MKNILIVTTSVFVMSSAFAEIKVNTVESQSEIEKVQSGVTEKSMSDRDGKKLLFTASTGIEFGTVFSALEAGYYINSNNILSLKLSNLLTNYRMGINDSTANRIWERDGKGHAISLDLKSFLSKTFYIKPGIYARNQEYIHSVKREYSLSASKFVVSSVDEGSINDLGLTLRIGNQWQLKKFTIGCDWVGVGGSVLTMKKTGNLKERAVASSLVNFYLGMSF